VSQSNIELLLENNKNWAAEQVAQDPDFFKRHVNGQTPKYLWISCSDSRVPVSQITGMGPGEVFVHRNVANRVVHEDNNLQSVIQYAIEALKVEHIIVCGHYGCGGVKAGTEGGVTGCIRNWVAPIGHSIERSEQNPEDVSWDRACELNALQQLQQLRDNPFVQDAQKNGQPLSLHAWIYSLETGLIKTLGEG